MIVYDKEKKERQERKERAIAFEKQNRRPTQQWTEEEKLQYLGLSYKGGNIK